MGELMLGRGGFLTVSDDGYLAGLDIGNEKLFFKQKINQPEILSWHGIIGQGPDEFLLPRSIQYVSDSIYGTYDAHLCAYIEITLGILENEPVKRKNVSFAGSFNFDVLQTAYNQYIGLNVSDSCLLIMYDSLGTKLKTFLEYPYKDADEHKISSPIRAMAYQGLIVTNRSRNKLVYVSNFADIINFYRINDGDIQIIKENENGYCQYLPGDGVKDRLSAPISPKNKFGFVDVYATDRHVYALYSGKTAKEDGIMAVMQSNELRIYDWSGELVKIANLDTDCKHLCISSDDKTMFAVSDMPEPVIVCFGLNDLEKKTQKTTDAASARSGSKTDTLPNQGNDDPYVYIEVKTPPVLPGGENAFGKFFKENMDSTIHIQKGDAGSTSVSFIVNTDGTVSGITIEDAAYPEYAAELVRVIKMLPKFIPAKTKDGIDVRCKITIAQQYLPPEK
jgi:hypothetical protein